MSPKEAAIEIIRYRIFEKGEPTNDYAYAALGFGAGELKPKLVTWQSASETELAQYAKWINAVTKQGDLSESASHFWEPIAMLASGKKIVNISPDGIFHSVSLMSLAPIGTEVRRYSSLYDLTKPNQPSSTTKQVLFAGALYEGDKRYQGKTTPGRLEINEIRPQFLLKKYRHEAIIGEGVTKKEVMKKIPDTEILHFTTNLSVFVKPDLPPSFRDPLREKYIFPSKRNGVIVDRKGQDYLNEYGYVSNYQGWVLVPSELVRLDLSSTRLVTISGAPTGSGADTDPSSIGYVTRGFLDAGVQNIVYGLWDVDPEARRMFMKTFYSSYLQNHDAAVALSHAQKAVRKKYREPFLLGWICPHAVTPKAYGSSP